ncbi:MAG: 4-(cytidine 5'-diphospho)-2-C-methyl-D-erythritol kinase [Ignavibacterium sp.]|nr:MAG: 4-(cytidine 5'-diphospho)-2-C-methyl-D-erythritol kinase [Ignavibacterium sp.]
MDKITVDSPAKINIGLKIIRKREDGYHDLQTIFYPLLLNDVITFVKSETTTLITKSDDINQLQRNLIIEAKEILEKHTGKKLNIRINLEKNIPMGAGLGGGSSNAATTLKSLNFLFNLNCDFETLAELALKLGSDVPYFLNPVAGFATSRGEKIKKISLSLSNPILLINPGIHISTKWAFEQVRISEDTDEFKRIGVLDSITLEDIKQSATNDFEEVVFSAFPEIKEVKEELYSYGANFALMTGTGSTLFAIFSNLQKANLAKQKFEDRYFTYLNYPVDKGSIT